MFSEILQLFKSTSSATPLERSHSLCFFLLSSSPPLASPHIPVHNGKRNHRKASGSPTYSRISPCPRIYRFELSTETLWLFDVGKASKNIAFNVHGRLLLLMENYPPVFSKPSGTYLISLPKGTKRIGETNRTLDIFSKEAGGHFAPQHSHLPPVRLFPIARQGCPFTFVPQLTYCFTINSFVYGQPQGHERRSAGSNQRFRRQQAPCGGARRTGRLIEDPAAGKGQARRRFPENRPQRIHPRSLFLQFQTAV